VYEGTGLIEILVSYTGRLVRAMSDTTCMCVYGNNLYIQKPSKICTYSFVKIGEKLYTYTKSIEIVTNSIDHGTSEQSTTGHLPK